MEVWELKLYFYPSAGGIKKRMKERDVTVYDFLFHIFFLSSCGWAKINLKLPHSHGGRFYVLDISTVAHGTAASVGAKTSFGVGNVSPRAFRRRRTVVRTYRSVLAPPFGLSSNRAWKTALGGGMMYIAVYAGIVYTSPYRTAPSPIGGAAVVRLGPQYLSE